MNNRAYAFLPLSLLLSTVVYAMDTDLKKEKKEIKEEIASPITLMVQEKAIVITPEQSMIMQAPILTTTVEKEITPSTAITVQSKSLGWFTGIKDKWWGESVQVAHEIANDKFDKTIPANMRRLSKAIEHLTHEQSQKNLKLMNEILENCSAKEIIINDVPVLQLARKYAIDMRTKEEAQLTEEAKVALQNADKERIALINDLKKKFVEMIEKVNANDKTLTDELDKVYKKHGEIILLGTTAKRLTRSVNKHIPADDYDSDNESKYDRQFNSRKLGLEQPTLINHKLNQRVADNCETIKNIVELADKQKIKAQGETI